MGFPSTVNVQPAIAVAGDIASDNPRFTAVPPLGLGAFIAGSLGVTVAAFAFQDPLDSTALNSYGTSAPVGFISREGLRADILTPGPGYPDYSMTILGGSFITAFSGGDFFVRNSGATASAIGNKAYASYADGSVTFAATGTPPTSATLTTITVALNNLNVSAIAINAFTGSISGTTLTVTAVATGGLYVDQVIAGGGANNPVDPGTVIVSQLTGTAGSTGTYEVSISQTVASGAMTGSGAWLTVTSMTTGKVWPGQVLSGGGATTANVLVGGTGTGGAGTYPLDDGIAVADASGCSLTGAFMTLTTLASGTLRAGDLVSSASGTSTILPFGTGGTTGIGVGAGTTYALSNATQVGDTSGSVKSGVETKWYAATVAAAGELVVMTTTPPV